MLRAENQSDYIHMGSAAFWRVNIALISAAFCTFALIYCVQPLLPVLAADFHVTPAVSSLALSATTLVLALGIVVAGHFAEALDRKSLMGWSLVTAAILSIGSAFAPTFQWLLLTRALAGVALSGLPAVAMAYVGEEIDPRSGGFAMGLYVGGTALGGMSGRLWAGILCDMLSWRLAVGIIGIFGLIASILFWVLLPRSRHFVPRVPRRSELWAAMSDHWLDRGLRWLFFMGFLLMGGFVSVYSYLEFRLVMPPYSLRQSTIGLLFMVYVVGMFSSAWAGKLAGQHGHHAVLWTMVAVMTFGVLLTLAHPLLMVIGGLSAVTFGFFGGHAVVSGWVTRRATNAKALASSLYLFAYYVGSSLVGTVAGRFWSTKGWPGVVAAVGALMFIALVVSLHLTRLSPMPQATFAAVEQ